MLTALQTLELKPEKQTSQVQISPQFFYTLAGSLYKHYFWQLTSTNTNSGDKWFNMAQCYREKQLNY